MVEIKLGSKKKNLKLVIIIECVMCHISYLTLCSAFYMLLFNLRSLLFVFWHGTYFVLNFSGQFVHFVGGLETNWYT